jgi:hypothetical protein
MKLTGCGRNLPDRESFTHVIDSPGHRTQLHQKVAVQNGPVPYLPTSAKHQRPHQRPTAHVLKVPQITIMWQVSCPLRQSPRCRNIAITPNESLARIQIKSDTSLAKFRPSPPRQRSWLAATLLGSCTAHRMFTPNLVNPSVHPPSQADTRPAYAGIPASHHSSVRPIK